MLRTTTTTASKNNGARSSTAGLTSSQKSFLARHGVPSSRVLDATGLKRREYRQIMEEHGYSVAVGVTPCANYGHAMRNRFGTCLQCNPAAFAFERRYEEAATLYIARSHVKGIIKIGIAGDLFDRERSLNSHGYAGASDWTIVFQATCQAAARVELNIQNRLAGFFEPTSFIKAGELVQCKETFSCDAAHAIRVAEQVIAQMAGGAD